MPSTPELAGANVELPRIAGSETCLRERLGAVRERYLLTLLDCPPSLGPLTVNALVAADSVIVPVQTEYFALEGLAGLLDTLGLIQRELNPRLTISGMILTMHDARTRLARDVEREVREHFPELVFDTVIPRNVRLGEAPSFGVPALRHAPQSAGTAAYLQARQGSGGAWLSARRPTGPGSTRPSPAARRRASPRSSPGQRRGMGRGLAAILPRGQGGGEGLRQIPLELVEPNPHQPRQNFDAASLEELAESIRARGVLQPVVVRPLAGGRYQLVAGERRLRAARLAELDLIPAVVRHTEDWEGLDLALAENMAREDLNAVEEARACAMLVEDLGPHQGGGGPPRRPQPGGDLQPDPPARPPGGGARADRGRPAQRGPRPRHPDLQGPRAQARPRRGPPATRAGRCARPSAGRARRPAPRRRASARRSSCTPTSPRRSPPPRTRWEPRSAAT